MVVLAAIANILIQKLGLGYPQTVKGELERLSKAISSISSVAEEAERKAEEGNFEVRNWVENVTDVLYDAQDVVSEFEYHDVHRGVMDHLMEGKVGDFLSKSIPVAFQSEMNRKVKAIRKRLDALVEDEARNLKVTQLRAGRRREREPTHSFVDFSEIIGRECDRDIIVGLLLKEPEKDG